MNHKYLNILRYLMTAPVLPVWFRMDLYSASNKTSAVDRDILELCDVIFPPGDPGGCIIPLKESRLEYLTETIKSEIPEILQPFEASDVLNAEEIRGLLRLTINGSKGAALAVALNTFPLTYKYGVSLDGDKKYREELGNLIRECEAMARYIDRKSSTLYMPDYVLGGDPSLCVESIRTAKDRLRSETLVYDMCFRTGNTGLNSIFATSNDPHGNLFPVGSTVCVTGYPGQKKSVFVQNILAGLPVFSDFSLFRLKYPDRIPAIVHFELENRMDQSLARTELLIGHYANPRAKMDALESYAQQATECAVIPKHFTSNTMTAQDLIQVCENIPLPYKVVGMTLDYLDELNVDQKGGNSRNKDNQFQQRADAMRTLAAYCRGANMIHIEIFQFSKSAIKDGMRIPLVMDNGYKILEGINIGDIIGSSELTKIPDRVITCVPLFENPEDIMEGGGNFPKYMGMKILRDRQGMPEGMAPIMFTEFMNPVCLVQDYKRPAETWADLADRKKKGA